MKTRTVGLLALAALLCACAGMEPVRVYTAQDIINRQNSEGGRTYMTGSRIPLQGVAAASVMDNRTDIRDIVQDSHQINMERH